MNSIVLAVVILGLVHRAYGLICHDCTQTDYDGESGLTGNCYSTTSATTPETCPTTAGLVYYCRTMFTIQDGVTTAVDRGCVATTFDEDENTASVPGADKCVTGLSTSENPTDTTMCYFHCTTDNCNTKTDASLSPCSTDCNMANSPVGGSCNYITGTCVCNSGFSGADCTTTTAASAQRMCVQCNSLTDDTGCSSTTTPSTCPGTEEYCSTATTSIYDSSFTIVRTVSTRGCTMTHVAVDQCAFTNIFGDSPISDDSVGYKECTCHSTCDTDGCNTNTADGVVNGNEAVVLQCVQCSDLTGSGACSNPAIPLTKSVCASGSTHCKSTVTYLISNRTDLFNSEETPAYSLVSVVRECATAEVTSQCTTSSVGSLSLDKVTCTETCQTDGCNTGWPARPTCITCSTNVADYKDGYDECSENPPDAAICTYPYQSHCVVQESGIEKSTGGATKGYPHRVVRSCMYFDIETGCSSTTINSRVIEACNRTCTTDGCNVGSLGSGSSMPLQNMAALIAPIIGGWFAQYL